MSVRWSLNYPYLFIWYLVSTEYLSRLLNHKMISNYPRLCFKHNFFFNLRNKLCKSSVARTPFILPAPHWSLEELRILGGSDNSIVNEEGVEKLARLSCIDLEAASSKVSKEEICRDINVILNCARVLQVPTIMKHIFHSHPIR